METQKIVNSLNGSDNENPKFSTKKSYIIDSETKGNYLPDKKKTLWPLFMDGVQLSQDYSHFEEAVYFLPFSLLFAIQLVKF